MFNDEESQIDRDRLIDWMRSRQSKIGSIRVTQRKIFVNSPWAHDTKFHCALFPERGKFGRFRDFKSDKSGSVPDFIMEIDGCNFREAMIAVGFQSGLHAAIAAKKKRKKSLIESDPDASLEIPGSPIRLKKDCKDAIAEAAYNYIMERDIDPRRHEMYVCTDDRRWNDPKSGSSHYQKLYGRILVPFRDENHNIVYWTARTIDPEEKPRYHEPFESEVRVPKESIVYAPSWDFNGKTVLLTEGWACTASLTDCGFYACSSQGSMLYKEQARVLKKKNARLVFAFDRDTPGRKGVVNGRKLFLSIGGNDDIGFIFPPDGHDWNSAKREYGAEWVVDYVHENVKPLDDYTVFLIESTVVSIKDSRKSRKYI